MRIKDDTKVFCKHCGWKSVAKQTYIYERLGHTGGICPVCRKSVNIKQGD